MASLAGGGFNALTRRDKNELLQLIKKIITGSSEDLSEL